MQGGTFFNDAVLRAFENLTGKQALRPDIAGNMGAYGAALLARDRYQAAVRTATEPLSPDLGDAPAMLGALPLRPSGLAHKTVRCKACANPCLLTVNDFGKDEATGKHRRFITGNRCEKGAGVAQREERTCPTCSKYKAERTFGYEPLAPTPAPAAPSASRARSTCTRTTVLVHLLHEAGLARGTFRSLHEEKPTRRASKACRRKACATRRSSRTATS